MSSVFADHKLEQLDWISQVTETIDSNLNHLLAELPDRTLLKVGDIIESSGSSRLSLSVRNMFCIITNKHERRRHDGEHGISWDEERLVERCFSFEIVGEPELDLRNRYITGGEIYFVKHKFTLSDEELQKIMGKKGIEEMAHTMDYSSISHERLNEVLDILGGCQDAIRNRSARKKCSAMIERLSTILTTNEWRIRDCALADKVSYWIRGYVRDGNLADFTNLCKLKVMTHNSMPIYSIKEEI